MPKARAAAMPMPVLQADRLVDTEKWVTAYGTHKEGALHCGIELGVGLYALKQKSKVPRNFAATVVEDVTKHGHHLSLQDAHKYIHIGDLVALCPSIRYMTAQLASKRKLMDAAGYLVSQFNSDEGMRLKWGGKKDN